MDRKRLLDVLDRRLAESEYVAGPNYTIADIAIFPWYGGLAKFNQYGAAEFLAVHEYRNVQRWADKLLERPAVRRGRMVNRLPASPRSNCRSGIGSTAERILSLSRNPTSAGQGMKARRQQEMTAGWIVFLLIATLGLLYVKWTPYWYKAFV